jgi:hypothetical protein
VFTDSDAQVVLVVLRLVQVSLVTNRFVHVSLVAKRFVHVSLVTLRLAQVSFITLRFVQVSFTVELFTTESPAIVAPVDLRLLIELLVIKRLLTEPLLRLKDDIVLVPTRRCINVPILELTPLETRLVVVIIPKTALFADMIGTDNAPVVIEFENTALLDLSSVMVPELEVRKSTDPLLILALVALMLVDCRLSTVAFVKCAFVTMTSEIMRLFPRDASRVILGSGDLLVKTIF